MRDNGLKQLWSEGKPAVGLWTMIGNEAVVEVAAKMDLDYILLDCEHGLTSYEAILPQLRAMNGERPTSVVRVPSSEPAIFKRVLDMGAEAVLVPQVRSAEEVVGIVAACRYPPVGDRGVAGGRAAAYGLDFKDYLARANEQIAVIVQIETTEAVDNVDAIMAVEGLDAALIGPADLSTVLGCSLDFEAPKFLAAVEKIQAAARAVGKPMGMFCGSPKETKKRLEQGFQMVNIGTDMTFLVTAMARGIREVREAM